MYCTNIYSKATIHVSELILTPVSPFDIKYKKCNAKNLRKCIFTASSRVSFAYFPKTALGHGYAISKMQLFVTKNKKQLKTIIDCC